MKNQKAPEEATGDIRIRSMDKRRTRRLGLGADHSTHEESRGLVSEYRSERSTLDLDDPRRSTESV
jgi:hypothetical protein